MKISHTIIIIIIIIIINYLQSMGLCVQNEVQCKSFYHWQYQNT